MMSQLTPVSLLYYSSPTQVTTATTSSTATVAAEPTVMSSMRQQEVESTVSSTSSSSVSSTTSSQSQSQSPPSASSSAPSAIPPYFINPHKRRVPAHRKADSTSDGDYAYKGNPSTGSGGVIQYDGSNVLGEASGSVIEEDDLGESEPEATKRMRLSREREDELYRLAKVLPVTLTRFELEGIVRCGMIETTEAVRLECIKKLLTLQIPLADEDVAGMLKEVLRVCEILDFLPPGFVAILSSMQINAYPAEKVFAILFSIRVFFMKRGATSPTSSPPPGNSASAVDNAFGPAARVTGLYLSLYGVQKDEKSKEILKLDSTIPAESLALLVELFDLSMQEFCSLAFWIADLDVKGLWTMVHLITVFDYGSLIHLKSVLSGFPAASSNSSMKPSSPTKQSDLFDVQSSRDVLQQQQQQQIQQLMSSPIKHQQVQQLMSSPIKQQQQQSMTVMKMAKTPPTAASATTAKITSTLSPSTILSNPNTVNVSNAMSDAAMSLMTLQRNDPFGRANPIVNAASNSNVNPNAINPASISTSQYNSEISPYGIITPTSTPPPVSSQQQQQQQPAMSPSATSPLPVMMPQTLSPPPPSQPQPQPQAQVMTTAQCASKRTAGLKLVITKQPPSKTVYQRILKPFPTVLLKSAGDQLKACNASNLFVEASLIRADTGENAKRCLEGTVVVKMTSNTAAEFRKLKILSTTQQQGTLFRLQFTLKHYVGTNFCPIPGVVAFSDTIEVFSHTLYLSLEKRRSMLSSFSQQRQYQFVQQQQQQQQELGLPSIMGAVPGIQMCGRVVPTISDVVPDKGVSEGEKIVIFGKDFINSEALCVSFNGCVGSTIMFHDQATLVCVVPILRMPDPTLSEMESFVVNVKVSNDGVNFSNALPIDYYPKN